MVSCGNLGGYVLTTQVEFFFKFGGIEIYPYGVGEVYTIIQLWYFDENYVGFSHKTLDFLLDMRKHLVILPHFVLDENYVDFSQKTMMFY